MFSFLKAHLPGRGARKIMNVARVAPSKPQPKPQHSARPAERAMPVTPAPTYHGRIDRPSARGVLTGYEPRQLRDYQAPISVNAKGVAGLGLFASGFADTNVYNGQQGEMGFYKVLCMTDLVDRMSSYWSVAMPHKNGTPTPDPVFHTDVDCVIVQGRTMHLIDLKYFTSGDVTWFSEDSESLLCLDNQSGRLVGSPRKMSKNMAMALSRFTTLFPQHRVSAKVVLIPTNSGAAQVHPGTAWPGEVPLMNLTDLLDQLSAAERKVADASTDSMLTQLLKN